MLTSGSFDISPPHVRTDGYLKSIVNLDADAHYRILAVRSFGCPCVGATVRNVRVSEVERVASVRLQLAEGLHWEAQRGLLWFVDIQGCEIFACRIGDGHIERWKLPNRVGWVLPLPGTEYVLAGLQHGVARFKLLPGGRLTWEWALQMFPDNSPLRLNDAKADSTGAVWLGSLNNDDESTPDGALYRLGPDGQISLQDKDYLVANGPALSADERMMLHTDSGRRTIYAFDLDSSAGGISNKRVWKRFPDHEGYPDGMCFDTEGCLWVAQWGSGCVSRFSADGGLLRRVTLPAPHVTNVVFGGEQLDRIFVSTARVGLTVAQLAEFPESGSIFEIDALGIRGLATHSASQSLAVLRASASTGRNVSGT